MVCAHASWALLSADSRTAVLWYGLDILFGCVAPIYLFLSGVTLRYALESDRGADTLRRHTRRLVRLLLLGVWLQIPILSVRQIFWNHEPTALAQLLDCNALHVIALVGLLLVALGHLLALRTVAVIAAVLALALLLTEPVLGLLPGRELLVPPFRGLFGPQPQATLPLFPFALYPLAGFVLGTWLLSGAGERVRVAWSGLVGGSLVALGFLLDAIAPAADFWRNSPWYLLFRLGTVIAAVAVAQGWSLRRHGSLAGVVEWIGRGSLGVYVIHLVLLYGSPVSIGLVGWQRNTLVEGSSPLTVALVAAGLLLCTLLVWWCWLQLRRGRPLVALAVKQFFWAAFWGMFLSRP